MSRTYNHPFRKTSETGGKLLCAMQFTLCRNMSRFLSIRGKEAVFFIASPSKCINPLERNRITGNRVDQ